MNGLPSQHYLFVIFVSIFFFVSLKFLNLKVGIQTHTTFDNDNYQGHVTHTFLSNPTLADCVAVT